jgi:hypothetical protein
VRRRRDDRGATLVEAAISYSLLFLAIFAVVEFGLAFKDWLSVSHASREGARAGATFGDDPLADIQILDEVQQTLEPIGLPVGTRVRIAKAGTLTGTNYVYNPNADCGAQAGYTFPDCCDWTPCPEVGRPNYVTPLWNPTARDVSAPITDRIEVGITYSHAWATGWFGPTLNFNTATDFQLEPQVFD